MELNKQVNTAEQGKRLTELGVNAESLFRCIVTAESSIIVMTMTGLHHGCNSYPAYTVAELGEMLKPVMEGEVSGTNAIVAIMSQKHGSKPSLAVNPLFLADCLIALLESKLITPEECNNLLNQ